MNATPPFNKLALIGFGLIGGSIARAARLHGLAGEIVTGGKQDRVIAKDRIVPASGDPVDLGVFCIEPGRWTEDSATFGASAKAPAGSFMVQPNVREKAMVAKDLQSAHLPGRCQMHTVVLFVFHERRLLRSQLLQHSRYRSSTDTQMLGERVTGHLFLFGAAQFQYRFQIVVYRLRGVRSMCSR